MASVSHTLKTFWNGKRFLKLLIFSLIMANVTMYCVGVMARRQVVNNAINHHNKVYTAYLQAVERMRKPNDSIEKKSDVAVSPYWTALREVRKQFPFFKLNVVLQASAVGERDRKVMDVLKARPRGWSLTDETEGWARSFYVLPTKNTAAFQVVSFVRDDISAWEYTAIMIGVYSFVLLFAFGWFWTRALADASEVPVPVATQAAVTREEMIRERIAAINALMAEFETVLKDLHASLEKAPSQEVIQALDEIASQIRMLAVNGSIEAARSADSYRVFHVMMQEINQLATHSRELIKAVDLGDVRHKIEQLEAIFKSKTSVTKAG